MAPRELHTTIEIDATAARVWEVLTDFEGLAEWNPFLRGASGQLAVGERLEVILQAPGRKPVTFRPKVLRADPGRELRWRGVLGIPGLFDGEHVFIIESLGPERVRFTQAESFRGLLRPFLGSLLQDTERGFEAMNRALKARAEGADNR